MAIQVSKSTIRANIYKNFYDIINAVSSLTNKIYPKYADKVRDDTSDYPAVIIFPASVPRPENLTATKGKIIGTIRVEVYATNDKDADSLSDAVDDAVDNSLHLLSQNGIRKVALDEEDDDIDIRGKIKGFVNILIYRFEYYYTKPSGGF